MGCRAQPQSRSLFRASPSSSWSMAIRTTHTVGVLTSALLVEPSVVRIPDLPMVVQRYRNRARCHCSELGSRASPVFSAVASVPKFAYSGFPSPISPGVNARGFFRLGDMSVRGAGSLSRHRRQGAMPCAVQQPEAAVGAPNRFLHLQSRTPTVRRLVRRPVVFDQVQKILMNAPVVAQFRMERRCHGLALAHQHRHFVAAFRRDHFHALAYAFNLRSADEYHFDGLAKKSAFADGAIDLASVSITAHCDVERAQARLLRILDFGGQQDASRAGSKRRLRAHEILQLRESVFTEQLEKGPRLAAGDYQAVDLIQLLGLFHQYNFGTEFFETAAVRVEVSLQS